MNKSVNSPTQTLNSEQAAELQHKRPNNIARLAYTVDEASTISALGRTSLYSRLKSGELPARKCGNRTIILAEDLQRFLSDLETFQTSSGFAKE